ncbi:MAG: hypothetical protein FWC97_01230 [Treponema sp.]|nr:hypothetical protein [Treponema sp.]
MKKAVILVIGLALTFMFAACPTDSGDSPPDQPPRPRPPSPMGGVPTLTYGIGNWPTPQQWDAAGEMYEFPNIFIRGDGSRIYSPLEWEAYETPEGRWMPRPLNNYIPEDWTLVPGGRREEVKRLLEHYLQGTKPPPPTSITVITNPGAAGGSVTLRFTANNNTVDYTFNITIPDIAPNGLPVSSDNKVPLFIGVPSSGGLNHLQANGWATMNLGGSADNFDHPAQTLWNFNNTADPNRPSAFLHMAWTISRIMDAIEQNPDFLGGVVNSRQIAISGVSRNGKAAMYAGSWAESQRGTRVAISVPASSGSLGTNVERWTSQKAGLNRHAGGYNQVRLMNITRYNPALPYDSQSHIMVKLAPRDWEELSIGGPNRTQIQVMAQARGEQPSWRGIRLAEFQQHNPNFAMSGSPGSGILGGMPFDSHFAASLMAPNVYMGVNGWRDNSWTHGSPSGWVSQHPLYITYLLTRELFDFLGVEQHATVLLHGTGHTWPEVQVFNMIDYANWFFNTNHHPEWPADRQWRRLSGDWPVATINMMTDRLIDDQGNPRTKVDWFNPLHLEDYLRITWKNPNRTRQFPGEWPPGDFGKTIADNVRAWFIAHPEQMVDVNGDPITLDYPETLVRLPGVVGTAGAAD